MLVDLGRNDLGRICKRGTVKVGEFMVIEKYSHVMHIVSDCVGVLEKGKDAFDVLYASFPAGTVAGAPPSALSAVAPYPTRSTTTNEPVTSWTCPPVPARPAV